MSQLPNAPLTPGTLERRAWRLAVLRAAHMIIVGSTLLLLGLRLGKAVSFRTVVVAYASVGICVMATGVLISFAMRGKSEFDIQLRDDHENPQLVDVAVWAPKIADDDNYAEEGGEDQEAAAPAQARQTSSKARVTLDYFSALTVVSLCALYSSLVSLLILGAYVFMHLVAESFPFPLQIGYIAGSALVALTIAVGLTDSDRRTKGVAVLTRLFGGLWTLAALLAVLVALTAYFSVGTFVLSDRDVIQFHEGSQNPDVDSIMAFYIWHFLDDVPVLDVADTLRWKAPLDYDSSSVGILVLLYIIAVVLPIVASIKTYWKLRKIPFSTHQV